MLKKGEALEALLRAQKAGKIRFAGYSGDNEPAAYAAGLPGVSIIMTSLNLCDQANIRSVLPEARKRGIGVIAKRPIANSAWKPLAEQKGIYVDYVKTYAERFRAMGLSLGDLGFKGDSAIGWPQIALRFTLSQPGVHGAIVGTCRLSHAMANLEAAALGELPDEVIKAIQTAFLNAEANSGQLWLGQI